MKIKYILGALTLSTLVTGCSTQTSSTGALKIEYQNSSQQKKNYEDFYSQELSWEECGFEEKTSKELSENGLEPERVKCSSIAAPFDWDQPDSKEESINLALIKIKAKDPQPLGTLYGNPGGPGESGLEYIVNQATKQEFSDIADRYDLIGFDPRGIGGSSPLQCAGESNIEAVNVEKCADSNNLSISIGTSQVARDMELLRNLNGDNKLNYLGYSYGTVLGATYATLFPENTGRLVLDSADDSNWSSPISNFNQAVAVANSIAKLGEKCKSKFQNCPFMDEESLFNLYEKIHKNPLMTSSGEKITWEDLYGHLSFALYAPTETQRNLLDTVQKALMGDSSAIGELYTRIKENNAEVGPVGTIVACHSYPQNIDATSLVDHINKVGLPRILGGPEVTDDTIARFLTSPCFSINQDANELDKFDAQGTSEKILVIGITGDHATPYSHAQSLVKELSNAQLLTFEGEGHAVSYTGRSKCIDDAVTTYLIDGILPSEGMTCKEDPSAGSI
ncbi:alpha/beta hydrolase [Corynebacterium ulcerans]|uniref:alpha/beta hydrolase n=1 Tax=Corynebacterium ulcerans TaxID=65058 RepID=UPI000C776610|nr:alpha/beta hydrolase [Corynebacterium ulcerans]PLW02927.1 hypothetical protein BRL54_04795 [Corynebacterium ulcerans]